MSDSIFLKPGDGALQPKPITNCWVYIQKKYFLIAFEENMYQFCLLLIRFDVCHHHSADLWLLSKEMVWLASVFQRGPELEDRRLQIVCSVLYRWLVMVLINASVDAWEKGVEQFASAKISGGTGLTSFVPCHSKAAGMGCLSGHHTVPGGGTAGPREASLSPPGLQGLWTQAPAAEGSAVHMGFILGRAVTV